MFLNPLILLVVWRQTGCSLLLAEGI